ncbi:response regulator [Lysinibacillus contaminans]|uniref:Response regulator n=1 Tax=Lysinibacillus contaminans TaxID=1293441 RepID=A0ABR5K349_9BACI|nr:LytTR family DNA-binding domain-containing protein [Lysinibacillus contaminans]KOS69203.1 response regulator [Lysinibacillus contaminans]
MKIHLTINSELQETEIHIHAKEYNEQIEKLMKQLQATQSTMIDGYIQQEIYMLKISDIYSIYAEGAKVFLQTEEQEFESKRKLYELEMQFAKDFARVSKSSLVNINKIASIQMGKIGSTELLLDNDVSIHVSRKYLKDLKRQLGIGREF